MDLGIALQVKGNRAEPLAATAVRDLVPADLAALEAVKGSKASPIKRLRDSHHALARALAAGIDESQAALICGYSVSRVSILKADPTFAELISHYRGAKDIEFADAQARMAALSVEFIEELRERIEETPEDFSVATLLKAVEVFADRTGNGPKTTQVNVNVNLADRMQAARRRTAGPEGGGIVQPIIDVPVLSVASPTPEGGGRVPAEGRAAGMHSKNEAAE